MKIEQDDNGVRTQIEYSGSGLTVLKEIFSDTVLESPGGNRLAVCMRDDTFELTVPGSKHWYTVDPATGKINMFANSTPDDQFQKKDAVIKIVPVRLIDGFEVNVNLWEAEYFSVKCVRGQLSRNLINTTRPSEALNLALVLVESGMAVCYEIVQKNPTVDTAKQKGSAAPEMDARIARVIANTKGDHVEMPVVGLVSKAFLLAHPELTYADFENLSDPLGKTQLGRLIADEHKNDLRLSIIASEDMVSFNKMLTKTWDYAKENPTQLPDNYDGDKFSYVRTCFLHTPAVFNVDRSFKAFFYKVWDSAKTSPAYDKNAFCHVQAWVRFVCGGSTV